MVTHDVRWGRRLLRLVPVLVMLSACVADPSPMSHGSSAGPPTTTGPPAVSSTSPPDDDLSDSTWNSRTAPLGGTAALDSGLAVRVSRPAPMTNTSHATGIRPHQINLLFVVTIDNGQSDPFDLRPLRVSAASRLPRTACAEVRDDASGVGARTTTVLPPGGTTGFTVGFSCPGPPGQPLVVAITPREGFADLEFTGQLP